MLEDFRRATWTGERPGKVKITLRPDDYAGPDGHVALYDRRTLYLYPYWAKNGAARGVYSTAHLGDGPVRLYGKLGMPDEATTSDGVKVVFSAGSEKLHQHP